MSDGGVGPAELAEGDVRDQSELGANETTAMGEAVGDQLSAENDQSSAEEGNQPSPEGEGDQPSAPSAEGDPPSAEGDPPSAEGDPPSAEGDQPSAEGDQPSAEGDQPSAEGDQPSAEGDQPSAEGDQPSAEGDQPSANAEGDQGDDPIIEDSEAVGDTREGTDGSANEEENAAGALPSPKGGDGAAEAGSESAVVAGESEESDAQGGKDAFLEDLKAEELDRGIASPADANGKPSESNIGTVNAEADDEAGEGFEAPQETLVTVPEDAALDPELASTEALTSAEAALQQLLEVERAARAAEASAAEDLHSRLEGVEKEAARAAELENKVKQQAEALEGEARTRAELEDMLLRIERHFKAEQAARRSAEEKLAATEGALSAERATRADLEASARSVHEAQDTATRALEERGQMEGELEAARLAQRKAERALTTAEETIRAAENIEKMKMKHEHEARVLKLASELDRCRDELEKRTNQMGVEMERWRHQAEAAASTVQVAKQEVVQRKREMDQTKEKLDLLMDKLYVGREMSIALQGAIDYNLQQNRVQRATDQQSAMLAESLKQYIASQPTVPLPTQAPYAHGMAHEYASPTMAAPVPTPAPVAAPRGGMAVPRAAPEPKLPPISARAPAGQPSALTNIEGYKSYDGASSRPRGKKKKAAPKGRSNNGMGGIPVGVKRSVVQAPAAPVDPNPPNYMQKVKKESARALHEPKHSTEAAKRVIGKKKKGGFGNSAPRFTSSEEMHLVQYAASRLG